jgi:protein-tyrosine-phosphatase
MAEAFLNQICPDYFEAHSAGLEPGTLNPLAVDASLVAFALPDVERKPLPVSLRF